MSIGVEQDFVLRFGLHNVFNSIELCEFRGALASAQHERVPPSSISDAKHFVAEGKGDVDVDVDTDVDANENERKDRERGKARLKGCCKVLQELKENTLHMLFPRPSELTRELNRLNHSIQEKLKELEDGGAVVINEPTLRKFEIAVSDMRRKVLTYEHFLNTRNPFQEAKSRINRELRVDEEKRLGWDGSGMPLGKLKRKDSSSAEGNLKEVEEEIRRLEVLYMPENEDFETGELKDILQLTAVDNNWRRIVKLFTSVDAKMGMEENKVPHEILAQEVKELVSTVADFEIDDAIASTDDSEIGIAFLQKHQNKLLDALKKHRCEILCGK